MPRKPDFVVAGFARCGTTWLYEVLRLHPRLFLPVRKEINFFNRAFDKGVGWYEAYFEDCPPDRLAGDISPVYAEDPAVPARLAEVLPQARVVLIVRNPVDRLRSSYWKLMRDGRHQDELVVLVRDGLDRDGYLGRQRYTPVLERYLELLGRDRVLILVYEEMHADPAGTIRAVERFLGVEGSAWPAEMTATLGRHVNPTFVPRRPGLYRAAQRLNQSLRRTHLKFLDRPLELGKRLFFAAAGRRERQEVGPMPGEDRLRRYFQDDVAALERLLGRPLTAVWR